MASPWPKNLSDGKQQHKNIRVTSRRDGTIHNQEKPMAFLFPNLPPTDPFDLFMAKLVGKKYIAEDEAGTVTGYLYKGAMYITDLQPKIHHEPKPKPPWNR